MNRSVARLASGRRTWWASPGLAPLARPLVTRRLAELEHGHLRVRDLTRGGEALEAGEPGSDLQATVTVRDPRFYPAIAFGGAIGAGEAYIDGYWTADDLTTVVRVLLRNRVSLDRLDRGWARIGRPLRRLFHRSRANSPSGSRRNIRAHYDLSNDFFRSFLDPTLTYSCAVWERGDETLEEAQTAKIDRLCRALRLEPGDHLLEIGTGWGALAVHAASRYGCRVTTTTLSDAQREVASGRVERAGLAERVTLLDRDYRDLEGRFDKLVSVEMIEAVGHERIPGFFEACARLLRPGGLMALQAITIAERFYEDARRSVDFIQRYVFPGGAIPSVGSLSRALATTDLQVVRLEDIGLHYARTLATWRENLAARRADVLALGFDERLARLFEYYFCYCEGGFRERAISDVQMLLLRPDPAAIASPLPRFP